MIKKILVAEDDKATRRLLEIMISSIGYEVETVSNGVEAVEVTAGVEYDLILMDLSMPKMDGIEATLKIRERGFRGKIFALTGNKMCELKDLQAVAGFTGIIFKTADRNIFETDLKRILEK